MAASNDLLNPVHSRRRRVRLRRRAKRRTGMRAVRWRPVVPGLIVVGAAALLLAGCGGSSTPAVAHLSSGKGVSSAGAEGGSSPPESTASSQAKLVAYAKCMRANGVPEFPEPVEGGIQLQSHNGSGVNPESAQFKAAEGKCHKLMPEGGKPSPQLQKEVQERALKFSACMRSHGEPNFPEPEFSGGATRMKLKAGGGLDPGSPQFQAAQKACAQYLGRPGVKQGVPLAAPAGGGKGPPAGSGSGSSQEGAAAAP